MYGTGLNSRNAHRAWPYLKFVVGSHLPTTIQSIIKAPTRSHCEITTVGQVIGKIDLPYTYQELYIGLEAIIQIEPISRSNKIVILAKSVGTAKSQPSSLCLHA